MRELGRGGALVAAAVAHLENRAKHRAPSSRHTEVEPPAASAPSAAMPGHEPPAPRARPSTSAADKDSYRYCDEPSKETSSSDDDYEKEDATVRADSTASSVKSSSSDASEDVSSGEDSPECEDPPAPGAAPSLARIPEEAQAVSAPATPPKDPSTRCDGDFRWIKSQPGAGAYERERDVQSVSAPDTDEEECRKIIKSKRADVSSKIIEKPPIPSEPDRVSAGSLDRRRHHPPNRIDRDQKSKSTHNLKSPHYSPSRQLSSANTQRFQQNDNHGSANPYLVDYAGNHLPDNGGGAPFGNYSFTPPRHLSDSQRRAISYEHFNRRHEHNDPQRYGSNSMLMDNRVDMSKEPYNYPEPGYPPDMRNVPYYYNSRQDLHGSHGELPCYGGPPCAPPPGCYYHPPQQPPPWCSCSDQNRYRMPYGYKNSEAVDERVRRLEGDKDSLQLQVSVLSEQIAAQSEKITDLERLLGEKRTLLTNAEDLLQREMLTRSSLETQKLELMSTISDARLRQAALERENLELRGSSRPSPGPHGGLPNGAARRQSPSPCPSPAPSLLHHSPRETSTPRTPPASYRRLVTEQSPHSYSSLPRGASLSLTGGSPRPALDTAVVVRFGKPNQQHCMVVARGRGHSVPNLAEKDTVIGTSSPVLGKVPGSGGKGWGSLFRGGSGGALEDIQDGDSKDPFQRGGVRATAAPRLQSTQCINERWNTTPLKEWDADITCEWLESMSLDCYSPDAKKWLTNSAGNKGIIATATPQQVEKELNLKNPLHKKKVTLALLDLQDASSDPLLRAAGRLDAAWALRWLEDAGLPQYREAWAAAGADGRVLHRLCHEDLHTLRVTSQLHALSIRRGIQVLRENNFSPDTMIRRAGSTDPATEEDNQEGGGHVSRWSSHRVMEWLRAVDLAEYAPNLRGAGVHGGLMYYEVRFTGELLATLLNIPPSKTLLRRHLNTRFNQLLGKAVIQDKREAEQTLGYQPLTLTSKVKITKKGQFTLKRKKNKGEPEYGDLVCPIIDQASGETLSTMKMEGFGGEAGAASRQTDEVSSSTDSPQSQRSDHSRS